MLRAAVLAAGLLAAADATAQTGVRLGDLPALARARNDRLRPKVAASLAPYLSDFEMDYGDAANRQYLDRRIDEAAALGDSVVPLLLEKLTPADNSPGAVRLAANSARVLAKLEPAGFLPALLELAGSEHGVTRSHAIQLLGLSGHPEAARFLDGALPKLRGNHAGLAVQALHQLRHGESTAKVAELMAGAETPLRRDCLRFLADLGTAEATPPVLAALATETGETLVDEYLAFLTRCARRDAGAAAALLPLLDPGKVVGPRQTQVVQALAAVAPEGHKPTIDRLHTILQGGEIHELGRACAQTLLALGDRDGRRELFEALDRDVKKSPRTFYPLTNRADAFFLFERWNEALRDYEEALRHLRSSSMQKEIRLRLARCLLKLRQFPRVVRALREAGATRADLDAWSAEDAQFKEALAEQPVLRSYLRELNGK